KPFHAELAKIGVPVHQSAGAADLATAGGKARPRRDVVLDGFLEPDIDVEEATAAARRGVTALQGKPGVGGGQQRDVLDGILDVEVFECGDIEVGWVKMRLDQSGHD